MRKLTIDSINPEYFTKNGTVTFQESDSHYFIVLKIDEKGKENELSAFVDVQNLLAIFKGIAPRDTSF